MFPELPPPLLGEPRGGTGGGTFSLITTAFCRSGGSGAPPLEGIGGAALDFFALARGSFDIGLLGDTPVVGSDLWVAPPLDVVVAAADVVEAVVVVGIRLPILFLDDDEVSPSASNRLSTSIPSSRFHK